MQLPSRKDLKPYAQEDVRRSMIELSVTLTLTVSTMVLAACLDGPVAYLMTLLAGLATTRLFVLFHDHVHGAFFRKARWAKRLFWCLGVLMLTPVSVWRQSHTYHHRRTGLHRSAQIGSFPVWTVPRWRRSTLLQKLTYRWIRHPLNAFMGLFTVFGIGMVMAPLLRHPRAHWDAAVAVVFHAAVLALALSVDALGPWCRGLLLPLAIAAFIGSVLFFVQHNFPTVLYQKQRLGRGTPAPVTCSSQLDWPTWAHVCLGNIGYHAIHHHHEAIPFYRLPEVWRDFPEFQQTPRLVPTPRALMGCYKLALWDEDLQRMLTWKELRAA
ncbi:fatty acid desaturase [Curvibacter sp. RS43]|jgi:omega-6 fatty acid desaturase (delta-12 desaturase)|uniref:fatty acid desaturase family protein n=1 Tax=Curvibacter microcysteis TaxID=3026419 RepID=UPI00236126CB|nr:fatty acid desaturase [Curvibacter sp. RS43]MDD0810207.1 fatty acid desaturase [Curvibacter sp. RS43]